MIDVVSGRLTKGKDWNQVWLESPESKQMTEDLEGKVIPKREQLLRTFGD